MKGTKVVSIVLCAVLLICASVGAVPAFADLADKGAETNMAWLEELYIRESSTDFTKSAVIPITDKTDQTLDDFREELADVEKLCDVTYKSVVEPYVKVLNKICDFAEKTGLTKSQKEMQEILEKEYGIVFPEEDYYINSSYVTVAYACLKHDALFLFTGKHFTVAPGTTLDRTVVLILAEVFGDGEVSEDIKTVEDFAIWHLKKELIKYGYPVSDDASPEEIVMLYKIMVCERNSYMIYNHDVRNYTEEDKRYLDGSYDATILKMRYEIFVSPKAAYEAVESPYIDDLAKLVLTELIKEAGESPANDKTVEELFAHASRLGYFTLDNDFYSDIYKYDVHLEHNCSFVWVTPFAHAAEHGKEKLEFVKIKINGVAVQSGKSIRFPIKGDKTVMKVDVTYNDGNIIDEAHYTLNVYNGTIEWDTEPNDKPPIYTEPSNPGYQGPGVTLPDSGNNYQGGIYEPDGTFKPYEIGDDKEDSGFNFGSIGDKVDSIVDKITGKTPTADSEAEDGSNLLVKAVFIGVPILVVAVVVIVLVKNKEKISAFFEKRSKSKKK